MVSIAPSPNYVAASVPAPRWRLRHPALTAAAAVVALLSLLPLGFIAWVAWDSGWDTVLKLVVRPKVGDLLLNTLWLEAIAVPVSIVVAVGLAWLIERTDLPGRRWWAALTVAPLAVPAFVQSYAWNSFAPHLNGLAGAVFVSVLAYSPFIYLVVAAQLRRLDPALEETAASLGRTPARIFLTVILPQLRLPICAGALLVGLHLLGEYGLYVLMRFDTFATAIVDQFQSVYNGPAANLLGGVLVLCTILLLGIEAFARGKERYARVGSGAAREPRLTRLGLWRWPAVVPPLLLAALALGIPFLTLGRWLILGGVGIWRWGDLWTALWQTLLLAIGAGILTTLLAVPMAWLAVRAPGRLQRLMEAAQTYVGALPGLIIALALVTITVRVALPLYQTAATLIFAYALIFLPRAVVGLRASVAQAPVEMERAAMSLGRRPVAAIWATTMRLAAPGAAAAMALVALGVCGELTGTLMLAPNGTRTLAMRFWAYADELDFASAAPYAVLMIVLSIPLVFLFRRQAERALGR